MKLVLTNLFFDQVTYTMVSDYENYSDSDEDGATSSTSSSSRDSRDISLSSSSSREIRDTKNVNIDDDDDDAIMFADSMSGISDQIVLVSEYFLEWQPCHFFYCSVIDNNLA